MENKLKQQNDITFNYQYILILVMLLFFGFTSLRFGMFGIGELILLYFCIVQFSSQQNILISTKKHMFTIFWAFFIAMIMIGYTVNTFLEIESQFIQFDLRAYIVILFLCFTFESIFKGISYSFLYRLLRFIFLGGLFTIAILYLFYIQGIRSLLGYPLTYAGSNIFSPFANDYHQFAYFITPLPFIGLYIIGKESGLKYKVFSLVGIVLCINIGLATTSSTMVSSWVLTSLLLCALKIFEGLKKLNRSKSIIIVFVCITILALLFNFENISVFINNFFQDDTNGENRLLIWSNAIKAWMYSPVFGLGPGSFSGNEVFFGYEAHNTFLQILTQGGITGGIAYILLISKLTKTTSKNIYILCAVISLIIYGFGINDLRRTVLWFYFILFYFLTLNSKGEKSNEITVNINNNTSL